MEKYSCQLLYFPLTLSNQNAYDQIQIVVSEVQLIIFLFFLNIRFVECEFFFWGNSYFE